MQLFETLYSSDIFIAGMFDYNAIIHSSVDWWTLVPEARITITITVVLLLWVFIVWIKRVKIPPDPWDEELDSEDVGELDTPICITCAAPVVDSTCHYCSECGDVTGNFTRYIPFVNIAFNYSIFATMWRTLQEKNGYSLHMKFLVAFLLVWTAPIMIFVDGCVLLWRMFRRFRRIRMRRRMESE